MLIKSWILSPPPPTECILEFSRQLKVLPLTAAILLQRGLTDVDVARIFLNPSGTRLRDFRDLPGAEAAGALLAGAITRQKPIAIFGDYDADGITATALMTEFIRSRGGVCKPHLPNRIAEGYGLNEKFIRAAAASGVAYLVTVDCGVTAVDEVALARRLGLHVIITDHHEPSGRLPQADALVDPKVTGPEDLKLLAGVGVALQVVRAAAAALGETDPEPLRSLLDLVALGTVADVVPLVGENRALTRAGVAVLNRRGRLGLDTLARAAGLPGPITATDLAFRLGPRLNAAGRMGDAKHSLELLLTRDAAEAQRLAEHLNQENSRRQTLEKDILAQVETQLNQISELPMAIVSAGQDWPLGVLGLVASKICERYYRPCFILAEHQGYLKGSGRSIPGFPLHTALASLSALLHKWGGHEMAAGVTLDPRRLSDFQAALQEQARLRLQAEQLQPRLELDAEVGLDEIDIRLIRELRSLEPFGFGNHRPLLAISNVRLCSPVRVVGDRHLKFKVSGPNASPLDVIGFGLAPRAAELRPDARVDLAGQPAENTWNGTTLLQIEIKDFRVASE